MNFNVDQFVALQDEQSFNKSSVCLQNTISSAICQLDWCVLGRIIRLAPGNFYLHFLQQSADGAKYIASFIATPTPWCNHHNSVFRCHQREAPSRGRHFSFNHLICEGNNQVIRIIIPREKERNVIKTALLTGRPVSQLLLCSSLPCFEGLV